MFIIHIIHMGFKPGEGEKMTSIWIWSGEIIGTEHSLVVFANFLTKQLTVEDGLQRSTSLFLLKPQTLVATRQSCSLKREEQGPIK